MEKGYNHKEIAKLANKNQIIDKICKTLAFTLLWFAFGSTYLARKPFGIIKSSVQQSFNTTEENLGYMDLSFSLPYSLLSIVFGSFGDKIGASIVLGGGLIGSAVISIPMAYTTSYWELIGLLSISGAFQSLTWPAACCILSMWFPQEKKTSLFGLFTSNALVGSIVSSIITVYMEKEYGWKSVFWIPSVVCCFLGLLVIIFLHKAPTNKAKNMHSEDCNSTTIENKQTGLPVWKTLCLPLVPELSITLFCIKAARNAIIFWLPYYLLKVLNYSNSEAGLVSLSAEIGGLVGAILISFLIDKVFKGKDLLTAIFTSLICAGLLVALTFSGGLGKVTQIALLMLVGGFLMASDVIIGGSVPTRIGELNNAKTSVTSVINGIGSIGAVAEGILIAYISNYFGLECVTYIMATFCVLASIISVRAEYVNRSLDKQNT